MTGHEPVATPVDLTFRASRRPLLRRVTAGVLLCSAAVRHALAEDVTVTIDNFAFAPTAVVMPRGAIVRWENRDDISHAIYCPALNLKSKLLDTNDIFRYRFEQQGTFDYICAIHPHMRGRVVVSG
jgi:plastocyanin